MVVQFSILLGDRVLETDLLLPELVQLALPSLALLVLLTRLGQRPLRRVDLARERVVGLAQLGVGLLARAHRLEVRPVRLLVLREDELGARQLVEEQGDLAQHVAQVIALVGAVVSQGVAGPLGVGGELDRPARWLSVDLTQRGSTYVVRTLFSVEIKAPSAFRSALPPIENRGEWAALPPSCARFS